MSIRNRSFQRRRNRPISGFEQLKLDPFAGFAEKNIIVRRKEESDSRPGGEVSYDVGMDYIAIEQTFAASWVPPEGLYQGYQEVQADVLPYDKVTLQDTVSFPIEEQILLNTTMDFNGSVLLKSIPKAYATSTYNSLRFLERESISLSSTASAQMVSSVNASLTSTISTAAAFEKATFTETVDVMLIKTI